MGFIEADSKGNDDKYGLRKNGTAENLYYDARRHCWAAVECDSSSVIEGEIETLDDDFFLTGYTERAGAPTGLEDKSANMGSKMVAAGII